MLVKAEQINSMETEENPLILYVYSSSLSPLGRGIKSEGEH